ncbi:MULTISPECIES: glycosyltransferase [unclassified Blastococcus]
MPRRRDNRATAGHVLVLGLNYAPETTGIAPYTTGLARHLAASGLEVTVVTGYPHYPEWARRPDYRTARQVEVEHGVRIVRVSHPVPRDPTGPARIWMEVVFAARAAVQLLRRRPDVVVVVTPALLSLVPAVLLRPLRGYRVGAVVQDLYGAALSETGLGGGALTRATARLEGALLRRVRGVAVIHEVFRARLTAAGVPGDRIEVIPNWAHVTMPTGDDRDAMRRELGWAADEVIALHAGNMGVKQGLGGLLDVARLAEQRGSSVRVVLLGTGSQRAALERDARGLSRISFLDPLPDGRFERALAAADCLLLHEKPGVVEMSVPSKLTTYFAAGRPTVAATDARSGAAALMAASGAGITVRAGDPAVILAAIEAITADEADAARFGAGGRRYAEAHLGSTASLARQEAWVRSLAGAPPGQSPA